MNNKPLVFFYDRWALSFVYLFLGITLLLLPHILLDGEDGAMLAYIPFWIGVIPILSCCIILFMNYDDPGRQIRAVACVNIILLVTLQLGLSGVLHNLFYPSSIITAIQEYQQKGHLVAVAPNKSMDKIPIEDQFQFAGRLTKSLPVMQNFDELLLWAQENPEQYSILFTRNKDHKELAGKGIERRYKDGWLILRSVKDLRGNYSFYARK